VDKVIVYFRLVGTGLKSAILENVPVFALLVNTSAFVPADIVQPPPEVLIAVNFWLFGVALTYCDSGFPNEKSCCKSCPKLKFFPRKKKMQTRVKSFARMGKWILIM
jgi:hypothetical protein